MEILQFLLTFLLEEYGGDDLEPLLDTFRENDFDVKRTFQNVSPKQLVPIIKFFLSFNEKKHPENKSECYPKFTPIEKFVDKDILSCLQSYFEKLA